VIADLHCHYPMKLLAHAESPAVTRDRMNKVLARPRFVDKLRGLAFRIAAREINYPDGWRVTFDGLEDSQTRLVLSVLFEPFAEIDFDELPHSPPEDGYFDQLWQHLLATEADLAQIDPDNERHVVVTSLDDLDAAEADGRMAFVHCVEGGFHLGHDEDSIRAHVGELAAKGVVYVTLAHLFWRRIATNANALPMLTDRQYDRIWCQPKPGTRMAGLAPLGEVALEAMCKHKVLVDVSHMRDDAFDETLDLLDDKFDKERKLPVIASHAGFRHPGGEQAYMLTGDQVRRIAEREGVVGLILAQHQLEEGLPDGDGLGHTIRTLCAHIDAIKGITKSWEDIIGIGSDLDGFIEPTMPEIERAEDMSKLVEPLTEHYGEVVARKILYGNARRVVRKAFELRAT
jgi:microsomal dipeptidase-like Zn-dependent dipeptidase